MTAALALSGLFLTSYLVYHFEYGSTKFTGVGPVRTVYFTVLLTHTILAVVSLPFIIVTVLRAWRGDFVKHRKISQLTWYMWFYVALTGPIVYLMLYQLYPASRFDAAFRAARALHEKGEEAAALAAYRTLAEDGHAASQCFAAVLSDRLDGTETSSSVLAARPDDVSCLTLWGRELVYANQLDRAIPILDRATKLGANDAFTHSSLGFAYFRKCEYREAARAFERAIELEPDRGLHRGNAGYAHYHYGNYAAARPHLTRALELGVDAEFAVRVKEALEVIDGVKWICPMHAHVSGKRGDKCSECGMALEPAPESPVTN
jgi:tetratricopeptide (TPR) repeat protein